MKEFSNKRPYLRPQLTVVDFRVERGFAASDEFTMQVDGDDVLFQMNMLDAGGGYGNQPYNQNAYFGDASTGNWGSDFWGN